MTILAIDTGSQAFAPHALPITGLDFDYNYTAFRPVSRFLDQLADNRIGLITWPGGTLSERDTDRYGFQHDGLFDPAQNRPGLAEMFQIARAEGAGLSIILPTERYDGDDAALRADVHAFMGKLLGGHYGPLPDHLQLEIGNEWYVAFGTSAEDAQAYGHIADIYVDEIAGALNDPHINLIGADISIAVQSGRSLDEDAAIRAEFHDDHIAEVDMVIHHRFALTAEGVDRSADALSPVLDAWEADARAHGGDRPELFLGTYNVGSLTRDEALSRYIQSEAALGHIVRPEDVDLDHRTDAGFESFWQKSLSARDYGPEHPRLLLEMFAEYGGEGMGGAGVYGVDMVHPGRFTMPDTSGRATDFVGQDLLDMLAESTPGTRLLSVSLTNDRNDEIWAYGFENADKLVVFLSADDTPPGQVTLAVKGLGTTYKAAFADSLSATVPADWMTRFGIPDNALVDETPEGRSFALGHRAAAPARADTDGITVGITHPDEVIRLSFAKTDAGLREIAATADGPMLELAGPHSERLDPVPGDHPALADGLPPALSPAETAGDSHDDPRHDVLDDPHHDPADGHDFGIGALALAFLPLLLLL